LRAAAADTITADIRVELDLPRQHRQGPMIFEVLGVPVNDGVEMPFGLAPVDNPSSWGGDVSIDIASDLGTVTVTGNPSPAVFEGVYVEINLHGAEWGEFEGVDDGLFVGDVFGKVDLKGGGAGNRALGSVLKLDVPQFPALQTTGINGARFTQRRPAAGRR